jgi:hypothetical protein
MFTVDITHKSELSNSNSVQICQPCDGIFERATLVVVGGWLLRDHLVAGILDDRPSEPTRE